MSSDVMNSRRTNNKTNIETKKPNYTHEVIMIEDGEEDTVLEPPLYHERQHLALCAVHAVNNLLQNSTDDYDDDDEHDQSKNKLLFTQQDFDAVCLALCPDKYWFNPHRNFWRLGNFDVNVVMVILQQRQYQVTWHDQRKPLQTQILQDPKLVGILWNIPSSQSMIWSRVVSFLFFGQHRHWVALLKKKRRTSKIKYNSKNQEQQQREGEETVDEWYNLDSSLSRPVRIGSHENCLELLGSKQEDTHVLLVQEQHQHEEESEDV